MPFITTTGEISRSCGLLAGSNLRSCKGLLKSRQHAISDGLLDHLYLALASVLVALEIYPCNLFVTFLLLFEVFKRLLLQICRINEQISACSFSVFGQRTVRGSEYPMVLKNRVTHTKIYSPTNEKRSYSDLLLTNF